MSGSSVLKTLGLCGFALVLTGCPALLDLASGYSAGDGLLPDGAAGGVDASGGDHTDAGRKDSGAHDTGTGTTRDSGDGADSGHPADTGSPPDAGHQAEAGCPAACALAVPSGWTLVAFESSRTDTCPPGFTDTAVVEPTSEGSCGCTDCTITTQPDCESNSTNVSSMWNLTGDTCDGTGAYYPPNEGGCVNGEFINLNGISYISIVGPGPVGGACTATATGNGPPTAAEHFCTPTSCASDACEPGLAAGFATCLYQAGTVACPSTAGTRHLVGSSASESCGGCDCTVSASGCSGIMNIYNGGVCGENLAISMAANGSCYEVSAIEDGAAYTYTATPTGVDCNAGSSTATLNLMGEGTVCCP